MGYPDHDCEWRKLADGLAATLADLDSDSALSALRQILRAEHRRRQKAEERIQLARWALLKDGYFTDEQVGDDIAPRITERLAALRDSTGFPEQRHDT